MVDIDHQEMAPPFLRMRRSYSPNELGNICIFDLRITQPNVGYMADDVVHTIEHFLGHMLPIVSEGKVLLVAPMGCKTGFYIVASGMDETDLYSVLEDVLELALIRQEVPLADLVNCGASGFHDLSGAQYVFNWLLRRRDEWGHPTSSESEEK